MNPSQMLETMAAAMVRLGQSGGGMSAADVAQAGAKMLNIARVMGKIERTLDEIVEDAKEDERSRMQAERSAVVIRFPSRKGTPVLSLMSWPDYVADKP